MGLDFGASSTPSSLAGHRRECAHRFANELSGTPLVWVHILPLWSKARYRRHHIQAALHLFSIHLRLTLAIACQDTCYEASIGHGKMGCRNAYTWSAGDYRADCVYP